MTYAPNGRSPLAFASRSAWWNTCRDAADPPINLLVSVAGGLDARHVLHADARRSAARDVAVLGRVLPLRDRGDRVETGRGWRLRIPPWAVRMPQRGRPVDELLESDDAGRPSRRGAWADVVECQGPAHGVEQRVRLAQNSDELADVLRTALDMVRADKGHDVFTLLDVLAQDRFPGMSRDACYQVARAVLRYLAGAEAMEAREPVLALHFGIFGFATR